MLYSACVRGVFYIVNFTAFVGGRPPSPSKGLVPSPLVPPELIPVYGTRALAAFSYFGCFSALRRMCLHIVGPFQLASAVNVLVCYE